MLSSLPALYASDGEDVKRFFVLGGGNVVYGAEILGHFYPSPGTDGGVPNRYPKG